MWKSLFLTILASVTIFALLGGDFCLAADKVQFATAVKVYHPYYLPVMAAEEKGFWTQNGLEIEWVPFRTPVEFNNAMGAGSINNGLTGVETFIRAAEKGLPVLMVAELQPLMETVFWVLADSPIKEVKDLNGRTIGVPRLGSVSWAFGQVIAKRHGLEGKVKFVGTGGLTEGTAALVSKAVDVQAVGAYGAIAKLFHEGKVRRLVGTKDYVAREWLDYALLVRKDFIRGKPDTVKRLVRAFLQAVDFVKKNPTWSVEKMMSFEGLSKEVATWLFEQYEFTKDGKINSKAVENVRNFLIQYDLLSDKAPLVNELYTREFTG